MPTKNQTFVSKDYKKEPIQTIQLSPGDFLYVPRGYVHDAMADDGISSHITIGVLSFTWMRLFTEIFPQLEEFKTFREAVPFWKEDLVSLVQDKIQELQKKLPDLDFDQAIERLGKSHRTVQPQPFKNYFESIRNISTIEADTPLAVNEGILFQWSKDGSRLLFNGKALEIAETSIPVLRYLFEQKQFTISSLKDYIDESPGKQLVTSLIKEGVIYIQENI